MKIPEPITASRAVILCGVSGSGKTRLARTLEAEHGFTRLSADMTAWEIHGGDYTSLPWPLQQELFRRAAAALDTALASALDRGERVVVDSTMCKLHRRRVVRDICHSHGAEPLLVYMPATYDTLRSRLARRQGDGPDDIIVDDDRLRSFCEGFEVPGDEESPLIFA